MFKGTKSALREPKQDPPRMSDPGFRYALMATVMAGMNSSTALKIGSN
jgi:hypothetical protein